MLFPDGRIELRDVAIESGRIAEIGSALQCESVIDAENCYVLPGLFDLHTHGIGRCSVSGGSLREFSRIEASYGATSFYPTLYGPPRANTKEMQRHRDETDNLKKTPNAAGFRLEWPYVAHQGGGVDGSAAPINPATTNMLMEAGGGLLKIWDISPELPGAPEVIRELSRSGVVCSIAHTRATIDQARVAVDAGARLVTHLFDTFEMPLVTDPGVYPAGLVDYLLVEDRVICETIADGIHVHPLLMEKAIRCKSENGVAFITDSNMGAGLPDGNYDLPGFGKAVVSKARGVRSVLRDDLMGSALTPIDAFRNAIKLFGKDISMASKLCSRTPARLMGLNKGEIAIGRDSDLIILDTKLDLRYTIAGGDILYSAKGDR